MREHFGDDFEANFDTRVEEPRLDGVENGHHARRKRPFPEKHKRVEEPSLVGDLAGAWVNLCPKMCRKHRECTEKHRETHREVQRKHRQCTEKAQRKHRESTEKAQRKHRESTEKAQRSTEKHTDNYRENTEKHTEKTQRKHR